MSIRGWMRITRVLAVVWLVLGGLVLLGAAVAIVSLGLGTARSGFLLVALFSFGQAVLLMVCAGAILVRYKPGYAGAFVIIVQGGMFSLFLIFAPTLGASLVLLPLGAASFLIHLVLAITLWKGGEV